MVLGLDKHRACFCTFSCLAFRVRDLHSFFSVHREDVPRLFFVGLGIAEFGASVRDL